MTDSFNNNRFRRGKPFHSRIEHPRAPNIQKQKEYYWVWGTLSNGKHFIWGAYSNFEEADQKGMGSHCAYEVITLKTRNPAEASRLLRAKMLNETGNAEMSFNRFSHK